MEQAVKDQAKRHLTAEDAGRLAAAAFIISKIEERLGAMSGASELYNELHSTSNKLYLLSDQVSST